MSKNISIWIVCGIVGLILAGAIWWLVPIAILIWIVYGIVGLILAGVIWWWLPTHLVKSFNITDSKDRADTIDNYRKTIGQGFAAIALIATFAWTMYKDRETINLSRDQFSTQQAEAQKHFVNQQFISAAQLLKESSVSTRVAGLYAIEQIASSKSEESQTTEQTGTKRDSVSDNLYLTPAIRAAIGFIKSSHDDAKSTSTSELPPIEHPISADTQSAIDILARLNRAGKVPVDLRRSYLVRAQFIEKPTKAFVEAHFDGAKLYGANLSGGLDLTGAAFGGSYMTDWEAYGKEWDSVKDNRESYDNTRREHVVDFSGSTLRKAHFENLNMGGAFLDGACLQGAEFYEVDLSRASLRGAKMGGTDDCVGKDKAHFYKSTLTDADFSKVDVGGVNFDCTILSGAQFGEALNVDKASFEKACTDGKTTFPASFKKPFPSCTPRPCG
ncbi:pentapeptide repeat-containing protein [Bradyrhizobium elkanii]|uniref:pentapeptide repeat-containing protein n=1 Tax=Bradyrhizobium elkanii TaxID=29448 RepID=UPI00056DD45E|nr:pentapeptide repeat-containing protein [Bradyrhizobium elkanii]WLA84854.1 pentapeptide repeat-containing protein [Bradyrhizobium elkanii]